MFQAQCSEYKPKMRTYDSMTMYRTVGCGNIYCIFNELEGVFYNLEIKGDHAKETQCGESWFNTMASILTYALRRSVDEGNTKNAIIKHLLNHRCSMVVPNKEHIVSCADAIGRMVSEYAKSRGIVEFEEEETQKTA